MGLSYNFSMTGNTYFAIDSVEYDDYNFGKYTNTSGGTKRLTSLTLYLGTGNGTYTAGQTVTGNGGRIPLRIYCNRIGSSTYSDANITTVMGVASGGWPTGTYGTYKFSFQNPVTVSAGGTVQFWWEFRGSTSRSLALCLDADRGYVTESEPNYTVTFDLAGGTRTGGGALVQSVPPGGSATPPTCSRSGYTFAGWNGSYTNVTSNRTITAKWTANTYTVTYNANGGTGAPASQTKVYGQNLTLSSTKPTASWTLTYNANGGSVSPTSKSLSRPFRTWNTRADGTGTNYAPGATYTGNAPLTLYAQYNNPTAGTLPTPTRSNCTFNRWTTAQNSGSTVTSSTTITKNTTIYAFWNYGVFLRGNGGTITIGEDTPSTQITTYVAHGSTYTIPDCYVQYAVKDDDIPSRNFIGWSTASSGSIQYQNGSKLTITSVTSLYAIYQIKSFTVVFTDGFGTTIKTQIVQYGQNATPPSDEDVQAIARPGYTFTGNWLGNYTNVISDRTIIALWGFTPIWILKNGKWVSYQAKED